MKTYSPDHRDALKEIVNIGVGQAASSLNEMVGSHIELEVPSIIVFDPERPADTLSDLSHHTLACVQLDFQGFFSGSSMLVFPEESAAKLVFALTGEGVGTAELNAVMAGALNEVGNILINGVMGAICNILGKTLDFSPPNYMEGGLSDLLQMTDHGRGMTILLIRTTFRVQDLRVDGNFFLIFEIESFQNLLSSLDGLRDSC
jgi:chemotaxis protein CheC